MIAANELYSPDRLITYEQGQQLAEAYGAYYIEVAAKESINVAQLFELIAWVMRRRSGVERRSRLSQIFTFREVMLLGSCASNSALFI